MCGNSPSVLLNAVLLKLHLNLQRWDRDFVHYGSVWRISVCNQLFFYGYLWISPLVFSASKTNLRFFSFHILEFGEINSFFYFFILMVSYICKVRKDSASAYPLRLYTGAFFNYIILMFVYKYILY